MEEKTDIMEKLKEACSFDSKKKEAYGQIRIVEGRWDGDKQVELRAEISLLNSDMLRLELEYAEKDPLLYFYEFFGTAEVSLDKQYIPNMPFYFADRNPVIPFHVADRYRFYGMVKVTIYEEDEFDRIQNEDSLNETNRICFRGESLFAMSPAIAKRSVIVIEDTAEDFKDLKGLYDIYSKEINDRSIDSHSNSIIKEKLNEIFNERIDEAKIDIYNVAQANFINCIINGEKNVLFDVGVTRSKSDRESSAVQASLYAISNIFVDAIILSHWDLDHILGIAYTHDSAKNCTWIAPDFRELYDPNKYPLSVLRLCNFLIRNGKGCLCLVKTNQKNKQFYVSKDGKISIWLGEPKSSHGINRANNGGLLLKVENTKSILLTGDCENSIHPQGSYSSGLDYIVIPHHGSQMSPPQATGKKDAIAYVSYGKKRGHCTLDCNLLTTYRRHNFNIIYRTKMLNATNIKYTVVL